MENEQIKQLSKVIEMYTGGQLSILMGVVTNSDRRHYCGTIENIAIEEDRLKVKLAWNATLVPSKTKKDRLKWIRHDELDYCFDLKKYEIWQNYSHSEERMLSFNEGCTLRCRPDNETIFLTGPSIKGRLDPLRVKEF